MRCVAPIFLIGLLVLLCGNAFPAASQEPPAEQEVLTNAQVIGMVKAQLSESVIVSKIGTSKTSFDLSVDGLIALKNAGVSDNIIHAMLESQRDAASGQAKNSTIKKRLSGHTRAVMCVAFSPDGKILASGGEDRAIILWDVSTADKLRELLGHSGAILTLAFSPGGRLLASGSRDSTIFLWDTGTGERVWRLKGGSGSPMAFVYSVAFSPDGKMLASPCGGRTIILWDVSSGRQIASLSGHSGFIGSVHSVAFSPDGKMLASGGRDKTIILWDVDRKKAAFQKSEVRGTKVATLEGHSQAVSSVAFSPDGRTLASGSADKTIIFWNVATGEKIKVLKGHSGSVNSVCFSPDGKILASGGTDKSIILWDGKTGEKIDTLTGHSGQVVSVAFSPDGKTLASACSDEIILWDLAKVH